MFHFHATQKLLNTSRIKPVLHISQAAPDQRMHNWYVVMCGSGFAGKMLLLYVHEPSLLTVVVKGKTIATTIAAFRHQLEQLLHRHNFPSNFIATEMSHGSDYVISKTSNKSMLARINQMVYQVTSYNYRYFSYDDIDTTKYEDIFMGWLHTSKGHKGYHTPLEYWMKEPW
jgi:hypothetical protein